MARYKIFAEYEGTRYSGWQVQKNARTVQGEFFSAIEKVFGTNDFEFYGSGRTDSGVHALRQVAHLDIRTQLAPEIIRMKLNDNLPADISVIEVQKAHPKFHARHDAISRSYIYQISKRRSAFGKKYTWWIKDRLDVGKMEEAGKIFSGMHDFRSFTADDPEEKSTKVLIENFSLKEIDDLILIRIQGSHFLWKMVRQIVGILVEAGRGNLSSSDIKKFLSNKTDVPAKFTAPPSGLFLERVYYSHDEPERKFLPMISIEKFSSKI